MAGYILRGEEKSVVLKAADVDKLVCRGDGDAALLHLYLTKNNRGMRPEELKAALHFSDLRLSGAETVLQELGLLQLPEAKMAAPEPERPVYTTDDISRLLEQEADFRSLCREVDKKLGRPMGPADQKCMAGLYDALGMPADVIYLLVNHCIERFARGDTRAQRLTVYQIEKEGYRWAQAGVFTQEAANRYLQDYNRRYDAVLGYMKALGLGDRGPVGKEKTYVESWLSMGFAADAVALAYEKTMSQIHELKFSYINGILKKWHEAGWHTAAEARNGDSRAARTQTRTAQAGTDRSKMREYAAKKR